MARTNKSINNASMREILLRQHETKRIAYSRRFSEDHVQLTCWNTRFLEINHGMFLRFTVISATSGLVAISKLKGLIPATLERLFRRANCLPVTLNFC